MAGNELKFADKVVFLSGLPLTLPTAASDPGTAVAGDTYYNTTSNMVRYYNGTAWANIGGGTVTSVALTDSSATPIYTVSGSPVTGSGTLALTLSTQSANSVFAGPSSGSAAQPTFRALVATDIPALAYASQTLNNLTSTAINASLIPGTDNHIALGSSSLRWSGINSLGLTLYGSTSGNVAVSANATTASYPLVLPAAQAASAGYLLANDGSGNLSWVAPGAGSANTALSNLSSTAINASLLPNSDESWNLGSAVLRWANIFVENGNFYDVADNYALITGSSIKAETPTAPFTISTINNGAGNTGNLGFVTGNATGGNSGNISFTVGTATGTQGSAIFSAGAGTGNGNISAGSLQLNGSTSGAITQNASATTTPYSIVWPSAQGASSTYLQNDGSGNLSWATVAASTVAVQNVVYVSQNGNDGTGTGSLSAPFLTIAAAMASITTASDTNIFMIQCGPGTYSVDGLAFKHDVILSGSSSASNSNTALNGNVAGTTFDFGVNSINFDSAGSEVDALFAIQNASIITSYFHHSVYTVNINAFGTNLTAQTQLILFQNVNFQLSGVTDQVLNVNLGTPTVVFDNCKVFSQNITMNGTSGAAPTAGAFNAYNTYFESSTGISQPMIIGTTSAAFVYTYTFNNCVIAGDVLVAVNSGATNNVYLINTSILGSLEDEITPASSSTQNIYFTGNSLPVKGSISFVGSGSVSDFHYLNDGYALGYTPTTSANWSTVPKNVADALDELAIPFATQSANTVWAGPTTGSAARPAFRALVAADIPSLSGVYANVNLSNLSSPTAINQDLLPATSLGHNLGSVALSWDDIYANTVNWTVPVVGTPTQIGYIDASSSGILFTTTRANTGITIVTAGGSTASTNSADIDIRSGDVSGTTSNSGNVTIETGTATGTQGNIILTAPFLQLTNPNSGAIYMAAGGSASSYNIIWPAAQAASANYVLTNDGAGNLSWALPSGTGANTSLSNLTTTSINTDLLPAGAGAENIGSTTLPWNTGFFQQTNYYFGTTQFGQIDVGSLGRPVHISATSGGAATGNNLNLTTAAVSGAGHNSGLIQLTTGAATGGATQGKILLAGAFVDVNSTNISNVADPVAAQDAATKNYVDTSLGSYVPLSEVGVANGVASLDSSGKVPVAQLPSVVMEYQGAWDPTTNTPALSDGTGTNGNVYYVSAAFVGPVVGLTDPSMVNFQIGDLVIYSASVGKWQLSSPAAGVQSVNGAQGAVIVNAINQLTGDVTAGPASGSASAVATIAAGAVSLSKMANLAPNSIIGNNTGSSATPLALTETQVTAMLNIFTSSLQGVVPASGGGTTNFLRADGTWASPGSGSVTGTGTANYVAYWSGTSSLTAEQYLSPSRGGLGVDASAFTGVLKFASGVASASAIVNSDVDAAAAIAYSKLAALATNIVPTTDGVNGFLESSSANPVSLYSSALLRGLSGSNVVSETYNDSLDLTDNTTASVAAFSFAIADIAGEEICYVIETGTASLDCRVGTIRVSCSNGVSPVVSITDMYSESADCGVNWSAAVATGTVTVSYTTTNQGADRTMRADVKAFRR